MGSYRRATMMGFLCRLCSSYKDYVIHLYSNRARELALLDKIKILPVTVRKYDKLPKTVCESCVEKLCTQYEYILRLMGRTKEMPPFNIPNLLDDAVPRTARGPLDEPLETQRTEVQQSITNPNSNENRTERNL